MKIEFKDLVKNFYLEYKEELVGYTFEKIYEICSYPFLCTKKFIERGDLPNIRLQYFGNFLIRRKRIESEFNSLKKKFDNKTIDSRIYFEYSKILKKKLDGQSNEKRVRRDKTRDE
jgi:hypothetical protein